jgi:hypothetical protein
MTWLRKARITVYPSLSGAGREISNAPFGLKVPPADLIPRLEVIVFALSINVWYYGLVGMLGSWSYTLKRSEVKSIIKELENERHFWSSL